MKAFSLLVRTLSSTALLAASLLAQDTHYVSDGPWEQLMINAPQCVTLRAAYQGAAPLCLPNMHEAWLKDITHWRDERRIRVGYNGARYGLPALTWTQSSFIQPQLMVEDRSFYDPVAREYTVDRYLDDVTKRYGGIDAVLIWPTYPNMGIDNRNQHDMIRSMPGGIAGVKQMVADFHRRGVRVFFPMMMWDQGTRDPGKSWPEAIAELMNEIGADGINGDTQDGVPLAFSEAADRIGHPLAFEPEGGLHDEQLAWDVLSWGQYHFQFTPSIDRYKWLEPRHMTNISDRWNHDKNDDLQFAFFNGVGWESWENVWGIWNGITPRDAEATRRVATLERGLARFLVSQDWEPLYPMERYGVFASRWPLKDQTVWTIVNRNDYEVTGTEMKVPYREGQRYFDLYHGIELQPRHEGATDTLEFGLESHGFGAILATASAPSTDFGALMTQMKAMTVSPLDSYPHLWTVTRQTIVAIPPTAPSSGSVEGMVRIPEGDFDFKVQGIEIEGSNDIGVDVQYPWETAPRRFHDQHMHIKPFYMDVTPVTNGQFKRFLDASHYQPADHQNFLKDWKDGAIPGGWENKPVTWVSLEDARAYAKWAGKRLPHEWEWQYAAQGSTGRLYPWGDRWDVTAVPVPDQTRDLRDPDDVTAHPSGASPFGVLSMVGNVWQWTDEYVDEHTRAAILRGGSYYQPQGSVWYFPQAYRNDEHGKLLLMAPGKDRAGTLGFRCVKDAQ